MEMLVKNALLRDGGGIFKTEGQIGSGGLADLHIEGGFIKKIVPVGGTGAGRSASGSGAATVIDAAGNLVVPPFIDPHLHLDAALTAGKPRYNKSGSHPEGIEVWGEYKRAFPGFEDFDERARRAVLWEVSLGTLFIRTHIDVCDPSLTALKKMLALREKLADIAEIQIVAFPQDGIVSYPRGTELMEEALKIGADLVGGIPHCEWTREDGVASIKIIFDLAEKYGKPIDVHCDETDDDQSRFLEVLAAEALRRGFGPRVSAGHATAMHSYNNAYAHKLTGLLKRADINIIANPFDNTVLQGRFDTYPKRRGITRVKELLAAGVNVSLGHDSIMDPWYPLGYGDMLGAALLAVHVCHMSGFDEIHKLFDAVTVNSAKTFGITGRYGLSIGMPANFVVLDARSTLDAVRLSPARLFVVKDGRIVARTKPAESFIAEDGGEERVEFRVD